MAIVNEFANLTIAVDSRKVDDASKALESLVRVSKQLDELKPEIKLSLNIGDTTKKIDSVKKSISEIKDKTVNLDINTNKTIKSIDNVKKSVDSVKDKDVVINVRQQGTVSTIATQKLTLQEQLNRQLIANNRETDEGAARLYNYYKNQELKYLRTVENKKFDEEQRAAAKSERLQEQADQRRQKQLRTSVAAQLAAQRQLSQQQTGLSVTGINLSSYQNQLRQLASAYAATGASATNANKQVGFFDNGIIAATRSSASLVVALRSIGLAIGAGFGVGIITRQIDAYTQLTNRLKLVTETTAQLGQAQSDVFRIANETGQAVDVTAQVYQRFAQQQRTLGLSSQELADITETVNKAVAISGATAASAEAALTQFGQALASGTFRGQEYNSVAEQTPALLYAIADGLGVTTGELRKQANETGISVNEVIKALQRSQSAVAEQYAGQAKTVSQGVTIVRNSLVQLAGAFEESTGTGQGLVSLLQDVGSALSSFASDDSLKDTVDGLATSLGVLAVVGLGKLTGSLTAAVVASQRATTAETVRQMVLYQSALAEQAAATASLSTAKERASASLTTASLTVQEERLAAANAQVAATGAVLDAGQKRLAASTTILSAAMARLQIAARGVYLALGGWVGIAITLAASLAFFIDWGDEVSKTTDAVATKVEDDLERIRQANKKELGTPPDLAVDEALQSVGTSLEDVSDLSYSEIVKKREELNKNLEVTQKERLGSLGAYNKRLKELADARDQIEARQAQIATETEQARAQGGSDRLGQLVRERNQLQAEDNTLKAEAEVLAQNVVDVESQLKGEREAAKILAEQQNAASNSLNRSLDEEIKKLKEKIQKLKDVNKEKTVETTITALQTQFEGQTAEQGLIDTLRDLGKEYVSIQKAQKEQKKSDRDAANAAKRLATRQREYVKQLRDEVSVIGLSSTQREITLRAREIAERKYTGALKAEVTELNNVLNAEAKRQQQLSNTSAANDIRTEILRLTGNETQASILELQQRLADLREQFTLENNVEGLNLLPNLEDLSKQVIEFEDIQRKIDKATTGVSAEESEIETKVNLGLLTQIEAREQIIKLHKDAAAELSKQIPLLEQLARLDTQVGEEARKALADVRKEVAELSKTMGFYEEAIKEGFTGGLQQALEGIVQGTLSLQDAVRNLILSIANSIGSIAAQDLSETLYKSFSGGFDKFLQEASEGLSSLFSGDFFSNLFSGGEGGIGGFFSGLGGNISSLFGLGGIQTGAEVAAPVAETATAATEAATGTTLLTAATALTTGATTFGAAVIPFSTASPILIQAASSLNFAAFALQGAAQAITAASAASGGSSSGQGLAALFGGSGGGAGAGGGTGFATGGHVVGAGTGTSDSIPAMLSNGEFVMRSAVTNQPGMLGLLSDVNKYGMSALRKYMVHHSTGGLAGTPAPSMPKPTLGSLNLASGGNSSTTVENSQTFNLIDDPDRIASVMRGKQGEEALFVAISRNPKKFKSLINS